MIRDVDIEGILAYCEETDATLDAFMAHPTDEGEFVIATFRSGEYAAERVAWVRYAAGGVDLRILNRRYSACDSLKEALARMDELSSRSDASAQA